MFAPMSLAVAVKAAAGVVLAADRRHTITAGDSTLHFDHQSTRMRTLHLCNARGAAARSAHWGPLVGGCLWIEVMVNVSWNET